MLSRGKLMVQKVTQVHSEKQLKDTSGFKQLSESDSVKSTRSQGNE